MLTNLIMIHTQIMTEKMIMSRILIFITITIILTSCASTGFFNPHAVASYCHREGFSCQLKFN